LDRAARPGAQEEPVSISEGAVKYPYADNGDFLIYHRLTGLGRASGIEAVQGLIEQGFVLTPFDERSEDERGEMFGIDPIDIAAGDGGAVFLSPFKPTRGLLTKPGLARAPGVAFRLSDLLKLGDVSVRPADFQAYYLKISDDENLSDAMREMQFQVEDVYNRAYAMEPLSDAFSLVRKAEVYTAEKALSVIEKTSRGVEFTRRRPSKAKLLAESAEAATRASEFISEFQSEGEGYEDDEEYWAPIVQQLTFSIANAVSSAFDRWVEPVDDSAEVLFWGSLPLSKAAIVFDNTTVARNRTSVGSGLSEAWPAVRAR